MRFPFPGFFLFIVSCLANDNEGKLNSNPTYIDVQDSSLANQPIVGTISQADPPTVDNPFVSTDSPSLLLGLSTSLKPLVNTNGQFEPAASQNLALLPKFQEQPEKIGDPTLDNVKVGDDRSRDLPASSNPIPSKDLAFEWRELHCLPRQVPACCIQEGLMWFCKRLISRMSKFCRLARLHCCDSIDEDFQCVNEKEGEEVDQNSDAGEQVGSGVQGSGDMTDAEMAQFLRDVDAARQRLEAADRLGKARESELRDQREFSQQEDDKTRNDAKNSANDGGGFQLPDWDFGLPEFLNGWIQQNAN